MTHPRRSLVVLAAFAALGLAACATMPGRDPLQVTVAGIEPLQGQGLEVRMLVKLRVQNPNDAPITYSGASLTMDVFDKTLASGVTDATGTIPRFGEGIVAVPMTVSAFRMARQVMGMLDGKPIDKVPYAMTGKLSGSTFQTVRFSTKGEFDLGGLSRASGGAGAPASQL
jgi:LEA14-like dessication related protein